MSLYRLVYYSENRISSSVADLQAEVEEILTQSRRNNALVGVTGALMFSSGYFGQVLEGPQAAVEATFERIQQDPRHGDVALLEFAPTDTRSFDTWAMAYVGEDSALFAHVGSETGFDSDKFTGEALFNRLRAMVAANAVVA
ncbi:BLUF domain-containing protein [Rhizobium sp. NTR19]|uniref:BLUF domain-containing protein n=1 Tax=Neorhizobium turbinariae TaxID=2937795 RepID=A0ABT0IPC0_9HYPH|nr:BLUF domain-containing protein [Neorhizobium turbinariae]MCK8779704.1 BLUF domain-containing protein [Neorhizobium turbinariae]